jgi:hypothetical protein
MNNDNPILNSPYEEPEWHYRNVNDDILSFVHFNSKK